MKTRPNQTASERATYKANYIVNGMESCPKFLKCAVPVCPLDAEWRKRVLLSEDPSCFFLTEAAKHGAEAVFEGAGLKELYKAIVRVRQHITARHPRIRRALERSKQSGFRMTRFSAKKRCAL